MVEFIAAFGIETLISAGVMTFYHYMEHDIKRTLGGREMFSLVVQQKLHLVIQ